jgi:hypothetical protein
MATVAPERSGPMTLPTVARLHALLDAGRKARERCRNERNLDAIALWMDADAGMRELLLRLEASR